MTDARLDALALPTVATEALVLREDDFRLLYERTARPLWVYLYRLTRDTDAADDLLQETYYRFLRTPGTYDGPAHEKNVLYRIATNLVRDRRRRGLPVTVPHDIAGPDALVAPEDTGGAMAGHDLRRALTQLRQRDQQLLWLAYAEGSTHQEIAQSLGLRPSSVRTLLFRARQRLAALLPGRPGGAR
ncbi:RNA polymerase sigma factor [Luteitalea sp. TBR-22]|uniref:RNA polymerase sigma factor n=1 Tax=Luteitalea sp. TBR-22 TaxID=2802971 RepID=UPI001AFC216E|nr:sigma-70 family RNA polymerase sigma factor [Luteitalea sp. TBR-22]BCS35362.1 RNA polymerase sigma factor [Luteitalea sp. TBR-22]